MIIDLTDQIDEISDKYEYNSPESWAALSMLWGGPGADLVNDCGVFIDGETVKLDLPGQKGWQAEVRMSVSINGWWAVSISWWNGLGGGGSCPGLWNRTAYTTRAEALDAGIRELIEKFRQDSEWTGTVSQNFKPTCMKMIEFLKLKIEGQKQMTLF